MDSWSCLSPDILFLARYSWKCPLTTPDFRACARNSQLFILCSSLTKRAILLVGVQEAWPIPCCYWRTWDLSGQKPEQGSEKVQTHTQQNETCVTQECWVSHWTCTGILRLWRMQERKHTLQCWRKTFCSQYFVQQFYSWFLSSNPHLSVTFIGKNSCVESFFTIEP